MRVIWRISAVLAVVSLLGAVGYLAGTERLDRGCGGLFGRITLTDEESQTLRAARALAQDLAIDPTRSRVDGAAVMLKTHYVSAPRLWDCPLLLHPLVALREEIEAFQIGEEPLLMSAEDSLRQKAMTFVRACEDYLEDHNG